MEMILFQYRESKNQPKKKEKENYCVHNIFITNHRSLVINLNLLLRLFF